MKTGFEQHGGCQCGKVRYTLTETPQVIYCCHCTECQKQAASAFGISVRVRTAAVKVSGQTATFTRPSRSGPMDCDFCPSCGTRLFHRRTTYGEEMNIKGGSFDDTSWISPAGHIWVRSKQRWLSLPPDALTYETQPEDYGALKERYEGFASGPRR